MKKLFTLLLAALFIFSCSLVLAEEATTEVNGPDIYALTEETLTAEQGPIWFYRYYDEANAVTVELNLTPEWGDNWQFSKDPNADQVYHSICEWEGIQAMPGTWFDAASSSLKHIDIIAVFCAPKAGTATIAPMEFVIKDDGNTWPNYLVAIELVSGDTVTKLYPAEGDFAETPVATEEITVDLAKGDMINFIVRSGDDGGAAVSVMPVISYSK